MRYRLLTPLIHELLHWSQQGAPHEVCGVVFGKVQGETMVFSTAVQMANVAEQPTHLFELPGDLFRLALQMAAVGGLQVGLWHSHPVSRATPSREDAALLSQLGTIPFIIVGVPQSVLTVYEIADEGRMREAWRWTPDREPTQEGVPV